MKTIELLLLETVDNLGIVGDVVKVKPGYARNYLLPSGQAEPPTDEMIAQLAERRAQAAEEVAKQRTEQEQLLEKLVDYELTLERSANETGALFGGVSQHDIAVALQAAGLAVEDRHVRIGMKINHLDTYEVPIQLAKDLRTEIKLWVVSDKPMEEAPAEEEVKEEVKERNPADRFQVPDEADNAF